MRTYRLGITRGLSSLVVLLLLSACGGGGGGGGGGGQAGLTQPPSTPVAITATNATQVAATALEPAIGGSGALGAVAGAETTAASKPRALTRALLAVARDSKRQLSAPQIVVGVVETIQCVVSGSVTGDLSADGTSGTLTFNACSDAPGETLNGSASVTGISVAPDLSSFSATFSSIDVTFTETGAPPLRAVGGFSISETCNTMTLDCTGTFAGTSLGAARGNETWFISNFTITEAELAGAITTTANYTVSSSALNGSVAVFTTTPLLTAPGAQHPHVGVVVATGSNNSKVQVTVLGSDPTTPQVQIEVDADGNNAYESNTLVSWSTLDAL